MNCIVYWTIHSIYGIQQYIYNFSNLTGSLTLVCRGIALYNAVYFHKLLFSMLFRSISISPNLNWSRWSKVFRSLISIIHRDRCQGRIREFGGRGRGGGAISFSADKQRGHYFLRGGGGGGHVPLFPFPPPPPLDPPMSAFDQCYIFTPEWQNVYCAATAQWVILWTLKQ